MIEFSGINWGAILVATFFYFILGGIWFAPFAFQKPWDAGFGFIRPKDWKPTPSFFTIPFIGCFVICLATDVLLRATHVGDLNSAIILGLLVSVGYVASTTSIMSIAPTIPKPFNLALVVATYHILGILAVSVILFEMK